MCRSIQPLFNIDPPATEADIRAAALQFARKISGFAKPSRANEAAFDVAVAAITAAATELLHSLQTNTPPRDRAELAAKAQARNAQRFGR